MFISAPASAEDGGSFVLVDEPTLTQCIEDVHHIFIGLPDPSPCLLEMLQPVCHPMFKLLCFAKQGVCNLRYVDSRSVFSEEGLEKSFVFVLSLVNFNVLKGT